MSTYTRIGTEIGELVDRKNAAYGSSFAKAGDFLRLLWPDGIPAERLTDALLLVRIFDKQMRIATDRDAFGESPYRDIAGYGLLGAELHNRKEGDAPCGTARADAETKPKATPASAAAPASPATTTSAKPTSDARFANRCSPLRESCLPNEGSKDVSAPSATASAPSEEEGQSRRFSLFAIWQGHNAKKPVECAECWKATSYVDSYIVLVAETPIIIHDHCRLKFAVQLWREQFSASEVRI